MSFIILFLLPQIVMIALVFLLGMFYQAYRGAIDCEYGPPDESCDDIRPANLTHHERSPE